MFFFIKLLINIFLLLNYINSYLNRNLNRNIIYILYSYIYGEFLVFFSTHCLCVAPAKGTCELAISNVPPSGLIRQKQVLH